MAEKLLFSCYQGRRAAPRYRALGGSIPLMGLACSVRKTESLTAQKATAGRKRPRAPHQATASSRKQQVSRRIYPHTLASESSYVFRVK